MLSEQYEALNKRIDDLKDYLSEQFVGINNRLDTQCDKCSQVSSLREKIKTLFVNVYAQWGIMFTVACAFCGAFWWMFTTYVAKRG